MPARPRRPSGSSTTRARPTRSARCTTAPRPWTTWSRSRSAASPSRRPPRPASGPASASTSSTRRATSTSPSRSSAACACSTAPCACSTATRAWSRRPRRSGARATSTACRASSSPTRWIRPAPTSTCASPTSSPSSARGRCRCRSRSAAELSFKGVVDLLKMKAIVWDGDDKGAKFVEEEIPADLVDKAAELRAEMIEAAVEMDDDAMAAYLDGKEPDVDTLKRLIRKATVKRHLLSDAVRLGLQEQGRAAAARRGRRLPALAGRPRGLQRHRRQDRRADRAQAGRHRAAVHARLQDHGRPARGLDHLLPRLFRHGEERHGARQHHARQEGARRAHVSDARQRPRADRRSLRGRHHRAAGPQGYAHRRDAVRPQQARAAREDGVPQPRHRDEGRAQDQGRRGEDGRWRWPSSRPRTPRSASPPTRRAARPSSRAWASCTSTSRSTSSSARTRSRSTSARRRWPTARPWRGRPTSTTRTRSRPAAPASSRA